MKTKLRDFTGVTSEAQVAQQLRKLAGWLDDGELLKVDWWEEDDGDQVIQVRIPLPTEILRNRLIVQEEPCRLT